MLLELVEVVLWLTLNSQRWCAWLQEFVSAFRTDWYSVVFFDNLTQEIKEHVTFILVYRIEQQRLLLVPKFERQSITPIVSTSASSAIDIVYVDWSNIKEFYGQLKFTPWLVKHINCLCFVIQHHEDQLCQIQAKFLDGCFEPATSTAVICLISFGGVLILNCINGFFPLYLLI